MNKQNYKNSQTNLRFYGDLILSHSPELIEVLDKTGKVCYINRAVERIYGYSQNEVTGKSPFYFTHPDDRALYDRTIKNLVKHQGDIDKIRVRVKHKNGSWRMYDGVAKSALDNFGDIKVLVSSRDVTSQKLVERRLKLKEEKFRKIFHNAGVGIAIVDLSGKLIEANMQVCAYLGYKKSELLGKKFTDVTQENHLELDKKLFNELLEGKSNTYQMEKRFLQKNGKTIWALLTASIIKDEFGKPEYVIRIIEDINDRKNLENMKMNFLSIVTHELRTPITTIKLIIQQMIKNDPYISKSESVFNRLKIVNDEITRITKVIADIYDIRLLETGHLKLHKEPVNISQLILNVIAQINLASSQNRIVFNPRENLETSIDKDRIKQVLINLLSNASKYSDPQTNIGINIEKKSGYLIVSMTNTGKPIPKKEMPFIFHQFYRVDNESKNDMGVGLWICSEIIKQHNGKIWAKSIEKSRRTTFYFSLPLD